VASAALTCPDRNNSIHPPTKALTPGKAEAYRAKSRDALQENVENFVDHHGLAHCFLLLVTARQLTPEQFAKCWNSAVTNLLREHFPHMLSVLEAHKKRPTAHQHTLLALPFTCPAFPHATLERCRELNRQGRPQLSAVLWKRVLLLAGPMYEQLWRLLQAELPKYGLGKFIGLAPVRESARAVACYLGKYLAKSFEERPDDWKHVRLVRYSRPKNEQTGRAEKADWNRSNSLRSANGMKSWAWRKRLGLVAKVLGISEEEGFSPKFGRRWFHHHQEVINRVRIEDYPSEEHARRDNPLFVEGENPGDPPEPASERTWGFLFDAGWRAANLHPFDAAEMMLDAARRFHAGAAAIWRRWEEIEAELAAPVMDCPF
jgi:hypothetical protein